VVSRDHLIDELWGERPPDTAATALHGLVSQLRKALEPAGTNGLVQTKPPGYLLAADASQVDADLFERAVADGCAAVEAGDPERGAATLRRALALWRGAAFADLAYESFAGPEIARLEELRLAAVEHLFDAELARGRHDAVIPELEEFVVRHPHRERARGQLMLALYRAQRQSDALELYRDTYRVLRDDLGVAPGPELRRLHAAILRQDAGLVVPSPLPSAAAKPRRRRLALALACAVPLAGAAVWAASALTPESPALAPNSVAIVDPDDGRVLDALRVAGRPAALAAGAGAVWAVAYGKDAVLHRIDARARVLRRTVALGEDAPTDVTFGAGSAWIATARGVARVDAGSSSVSSRTDYRFVWSRAHGGPLRADTPARSRNRSDACSGDARAVLTVAAGSVWFICRNSLVARIAVGGGALREVDYRALAPSGVASGRGSIWIVNAGDETVSRLDPATGKLVEAVPVGERPGGVAVGNGAVWVANYGSDTVSRIPLTPAGGRLAVSSTIPVGDGPTSVAAGAGAVWVANADGTLSRIDPMTESVTSVELGDVRPVDIVVARGAVWIAVARPRPDGG
jgi:DNA-binding SARP family transcriptional activator